MAKLERLVIWDHEMRRFDPCLSDHFEAASEKTSGWTIRASSQVYAHRRRPRDRWSTRFIKMSTRSIPDYAPDYESVERNLYKQVQFLPGAPR